MGNSLLIQLIWNDSKPWTVAIDGEDPGEAGFTGSVVIADFASLEAAKAWADADPYVDAGVYQSVSVKPFKKVF
ncbi:hypothetical protein DC094_01060 [Pelagibaculum spongiae]|uniref:YCII-related domain-containing protein n=1 Tax=Pelagibaculum spongiae TaxID=2080658 RepID=A0A2V1H5G1_9GAMM|nr:hypothetical protein DC094_01060 [Pelagibaculum spongiae]